MKYFYKKYKKIIYYFIIFSLFSNSISYAAELENCPDISDEKGYRFEIISVFVDSDVPNAGLRCGYYPFNVASTEPFIKQHTCIHNKFMRKILSDIRDSHGFDYLKQDNHKPLKQLFNQKEDESSSCYGFLRAKQTLIYDAIEQNRSHDADTPPIDIAAFLIKVEREYFSDIMGNFWEIAEDVFKEQPEIISELRKIDAKFVKKGKF